MPSETTNQQIRKEIGDMYDRMRSPEKQQQKLLKDNIKKNVERKQKRVGL